MPQGMIPGPNSNIWGGGKAPPNQPGPVSPGPRSALQRMRAECVSFTNFIPLFHPSGLRSKEFH